MLLDVRELRVHFPGVPGKVFAVNGANFQLRQGEIVALVGESGCGKSQTALALTGLLPAHATVSGHVYFEGQDLLADDAADAQQRLAGLRGRDIGYVFQDPMTALNPYLRIDTQLFEMLDDDTYPGKAAKIDAAITMLEAVRLPEPDKRLRQYPHQLSGGQRQRVMLAMALLARPKLLIADEPTTALDVTVQRQVLDLLVQLQHELGFSLLLITHDLGVVARVAQRVLVMYGGRIMEQANAREFFAAPLHPYSRALLAAAPRLAGGTPRPIPGVPPKPDHEIPGCPFAPRCERVSNRCQDPVPWRMISETQGIACIEEFADA